MLVIRRTWRVSWGFVRLCAITAWALATGNWKLLSGGLLFLWLLIAVFPLVAYYPPLGKKIARRIAGPMLRVSGLDKKIQRNFAILFGPDFQYSLATVGMYVAQEYVGMAANKSRSDDSLLAEYDHDPSLDRFVADWHENHRAILVSAHFGHPQAAVRVLPILGVRLYVPTEPLKVREQFEFTNWLRQPPGCKFEKISGQTVAKAQAHLEAEDPLMPGFMFDRVPSGKGKIYPFLGGYNEFATSPAELARRTGACLYFGVAVHEGTGGSMIYIDGPIHPQVTDDREADIDTMMKTLIGCYEKWARAYPEQLIGAAQMRILSDEEVESTVY